MYQAERVHGDQSETVAIKLLHEGTDGQSLAAKRLRDEARFLVQMDHPAILKVKGMVLLEDRPALVTEFLDGADLRAVLAQETRLPVRTALELMGRIAWALHAAATAPAPDGQTWMELVHRDVKPSNIHVSRSGAVKLLDFGVARTDEMAREAETEAYSLLGTFRYLSPEALLRDELTSSTDVWSLAATVFEALSGEALWKGLDQRAYSRLVLDETVEQQVERRLRDRKSVV